jgi:hypothetical protein
MQRASGKAEAPTDEAALPTAEVQQDTAARQRAVPSQQTLFNFESDEDFKARVQAGQFDQGFQFQAAGVDAQVCS